MNLNRSGTLKPETCEKGTKPDPGFALMESITPYPWHRDYKGGSVRRKRPAPSSFKALMPSSFNTHR